MIASDAAPGVSCFDDHGCAAEQNDFVAPVELIGFAGRKAQRNIGRRRCLTVLLGPASGITAHRIVAAVIAAPAQLLEDPDYRQLLARGSNRIGRQQLLEVGGPSPQLWPRLHLALVLERRLPRSQHLADRVPGHLEIPGNLLDRLALDEVLASNPRNRLHDQHPLTTRFESKRVACNGLTSGGHFWTPIPRLRGSKLHAE